MNSKFPPLRFIPPQYVKRRKEKGRPVPLPEQLIVRRAEIARVLGVKVQHLSQALKQMPDDERRAMFYKLTHEQPVDLTDEIFSEYDNLVARDYLICEIEIISLHRGRAQRHDEIAAILQDLQTAFANGVNGTLFEHEEAGESHSCRAVIRCTGNMFRHLVEDRPWQRRISWFEPKPRFETFQSVWNDFRVEDLRRIESPPDDAPVVCVVDSGLTVGNPFLEPVARENMILSFLKSDPNNPYDEFGHGSGVASLVAYHALNLAKGAENRAKVWIASARILNDRNGSRESGQQCSDGES